MLLFPEDSFYGNSGRSMYGSRGRSASQREYEYLMRQEQLRRQRAMEEQQRQEYARRRRAQELERYQREQQRQYERQMMMEEEYERRLAEEKYERQRAARQQASRRMNNKAKQQKEMASSSEQKQSHKIVRGSDGRLYRVPVEEEKKYRLVRDWDGTVYRVPREEYFEDVYRTASEGLESDVSDDESTDEEDFVDAVDDYHQSSKPLPKSFGPKTSSNAPSNAPKARASSSKPVSDKKKRITVIVEDVYDDDSDAEPDEMKSYWRNRHPSPNESWMEPVDF